MPLAPARLSTITDWPQASLNFCPTARATMSVPPPAEYGTMILTGLPGYACANADAVNGAAHSTRVARSMGDPSTVGGSSRRNPGACEFEAYSPALTHVPSGTFGLSVRRRT